jgi:hypothetical protein
VLLALTILAGAAVAQSTPPSDAIALPTAWTRVELPESPTDLQFLDVAAGPAGFAAVAGYGLDTCAGEIWTSPDGLAWSRMALEGDAEGLPLEVIATQDGGYVAAGQRFAGHPCGEPQGVLWRSPGGSSWESLPSDPVFANSLLGGLAEGADGSLVVGGCSGPCEGRTWRSLDGLTWEPPVALEWVPNAVAWTELGFVAAGSTEPATGFPTVAISPDGVEWTVVLLDLDNGSLSSVVSAGDGALVAGRYQEPAEIETTGLVVLVTPGGAAPQPSLALDGNTFMDLAWLGGDPTESLAGLVLAGWRDSADGDVPVTWSSDDGVTWNPGSFPREMKPGGRIHGLAIGGDGRAVAVGYSVLNRGIVPAIWVSEVGPV